MSTRKPRPTRMGSDLLANPVLVGSMILAVGLIGVVLSYNANKGLPFVPTYEIAVRVPDAAELVAGSSEVRIGGARVGLVQQIIAEPARSDLAGHARLELALDREQTGLPADSIVQVRPRSILGAKYLDLRPGTAAKVLAPGGSLPLDQSEPVVELDEAFNTFDEETTRGIRTAVTALGDALAGRGSAINGAIGSARAAIGPLERVATLLTLERTDLDGFIAGAAAATRTLDPLAVEIGDLADSAATTLAAVDASAPALGQTIDLLPGAEIASTAALRRLAPVLDDAAALTRGLRAGTRSLRGTTRRLSAALRTGTPVLRRVPAFARDLSVALSALDTLARNTASRGAVRKLIATVTTLRSTLATLLPAQTQCNILGLATRNMASAASDGDVDGSWLNMIPIMGSGQDFQAATAASNLHVNFYPNENTSECETGNEPYSAGQKIGNPEGNQRASTETTAPPPAARERARRAGLLSPLGTVGR